MERMNPLGMPATQPTPPVQPMDAAMPMVEPAPAGARDRQGRGARGA